MADGSSDLIKLIIARSMEGESQIKESWGDIVASRSTVRVRQWIGLMASMLVLFAGLGLMGVPLAEAGGASTILDYALVGVAVCLLVVIVAGASGWMLRGAGVVAQTIGGVLVGSMVLVLANLAALTLGKPETWHVVSIVVGVCMAAPAILFAYNQGRDLVDPMGWVSALERRMAPVMEEVLRGELAQQRQTVTRPVIRWQHGNRNGRMTARGPAPEPEPVPLEVDSEPIEVPESLDLELADFLAEAAKRGLGRRKWLGKGTVAYILPTTGRRVTRGLYDELAERAAVEGYITRGGNGEAGEWLVDPAAALDDWATLVEAEWKDLLQAEPGSGQRAA